MLDLKTARLLKLSCFTVGMLQDAQKKFFGFLSQQFFEKSSQLARLHPKARPEAHGVEVLPNINYTTSGSHFHTLDVYRPAARKGPLPTVLYVHGGGFRILSKDSHWIMALMFARAGYLVFNINYTLSEAARFPAAIEDCIQALLYVKEQGEYFGADLQRLALAGESAGANLVMALALAANHNKLKNSWASTLYKEKVDINTVLPACGLFQVSEPERFHDKVPFYARPIIDAISHNYLPGDYGAPGSEPLADVLTFFERENTTRQLPPIFAIAGGSDPIRDDTFRLERALRGKTECEIKMYPGRGHAFHAFIFDKVARQCWHDQLAFLKKHC